MTLPQDAIARIASYTSELLFAMGSRDLAASNALAQQFAASPCVHRSLAQACRNEPEAVAVTEELQQHLEWINA